MESLPPQCPQCNARYTVEELHKPVTLLCCGYHACFTCIQNSRNCPDLECKESFDKVKIVDNRSVLRQFCAKCHKFIGGVQERTCESCGDIKLISDNINKFTELMSDLYEIHSQIVRMTNIQNFFIESKDEIKEQLQLLYSESDARLKKDDTESHKNSFEKWKKTFIEDYVQPVILLCQKMVQHGDGIMHLETGNSNQLNDSRNEITELKNIVLKLKQDLEQSQKTSKNKENDYVDKIKELENECQGLNNKIKKFDDESETQKSKLNILDINYHNVKEINKGLQLELNKLQETSKNKENKIKELENECQRLNNKSKKFEEISKKENDYVNKIKELENECKKSNDEIKKLHEQKSERRSSPASSSTFSSRNASISRSGFGSNSSRQFNYPQQVGHDKIDLKFGGKNVQSKRYLSIMGDSDKILISNENSRKILSCDMSAITENCSKIEESSKIEGSVTCIKYCEETNFVIGTENGFLIKFSSVNSDYMSQQIFHITHQNKDFTCIKGLCADSLQSLLWWCVTPQMCYKVGSQTCLTKYQSTIEDTYPMSDIVVRDNMAYLLFTDKVKLFNIVQNKFQTFKVIPQGGIQFQLVDDVLIIASRSVYLINSKSGQVLHNWKLPKHYASGIDIDYNKRIIYVLMQVDSSVNSSCCLWPINC